MPTYDYKCENCEHKFERFQSITAKPIRRCPNCGRACLKRLIGVGSGVIFKGSGFYQTDYRSENYKKAAEKEKSQSNKDATQKADKTNSKESVPGGKDKKKSA